MPLLHSRILHLRIKDYMLETAPQSALYNQDIRETIMSEREQYRPEDAEGAQRRVQGARTPQDPVVGDMMGTDADAGEMPGTRDTTEGGDVLV